VPDKVKPVFPFHFDFIRVLTRVRHVVFQKYALPFHDIHLFAGGRDDVRDILARLDLFERPLDEVPAIGAELGNFDERKFFFELLSDSPIPGMRAVERKSALFLGAFDKNLFSVGALIQRQLGN